MRKKGGLRWQPAVIALLVLGALCFGAASLRSGGEKERVAAMERAIASAVSACYAIEGTYPASFEYLAEHYGVGVDTDRYLVDYWVIGENIPPTFTIIKRAQE